MKAVSKIFTGAAAAALTVTAFAAPAQAQYRDYHRDRGIDTSDIITGIAILGGIAAIAGALDRDGSRYGYGYRDRYRDDYSRAVQSCGYEAERIGRGQVRITDVDRTGNNRYRVRGVVEAGYDRYDRRYDRGYDRRYDRYDRRYDRSYDRYGRYDRYSRASRDDFTCYARRNGRIEDFRI